MTHYEDEELDDERYEERPRRSRQQPAPRPQPRETDERRTGGLMERRLRVSRGEYDDFEGYDDAPRSGLRSSGYQPRYDNGYQPRYAPQYPAPTGGFSMFLYTLIGVVAIGALLYVLAPRLLGSFVPQVDVPAAIQQVIATPTPQLIDRGGTILEIRNLNRLETNQFSAERVIEAKIERGNPLDVLLADRLLFIASGTVISGVDMSKIQDTDVTISPDGTAITINLPASEIFVRTLDNERSRVYDRTTGLLTRPDPNLETQARQEGEAQILAAACEANVLQKAADEAAANLTQMMKLAGFATVTVNGVAGECSAVPTIPLEATPTQ